MVAILNKTLEISIHHSLPAWYSFFFWQVLRFWICGILVYVSL